MILTVTLNPALDRTYRIDALRPQCSHRVSAVLTRAGGKGINVARILAASGLEVTAAGLVGGETGRRVRADLRSAGIRDAMCEIGGETRQTVCVHSLADHSATLFNEPGPTVRASEWATFLERFAEVLHGCRVVVLSGSLPPGAPVDAYATLIQQASARGIPAIVDASGTALTAALPARPYAVKPNATELREVSGLADPVAAAARLRAEGARSVLASLGDRGLLVACPAGIWRASAPRAIPGNPTGAGDACVAALAIGVARGTPWPEILRDAVALSAAAVAAPVAGEVDVNLAAEIRPLVTLEDVDATRSHR